MGCTWVVHGWYMGCTWVVHGLYMGGTWVVHGLYMGGTWVVHGLYKGCTWVVHVHAFYAGLTVPPLQVLPSELEHGRWQFRRVTYMYLTIIELHKLQVAFPPLTFYLVTAKQFWIKKASPASFTTPPQSITGQLL